MPIGSFRAYLVLLALFEGGLVKVAIALLVITLAVSGCSVVRTVLKPEPPEPLLLEREE